MSRYIDADAVLELIKAESHKTDVNGAEQLGVLMCHRIVRTAPTADVVELRRGEWTKEVTDMWHCSICLHPCLLNGGGDYVLSNFCHNCGVKMDNGGGEG